MKLGLIDVDGKNFPNLALMKISAYFKGLGDEITWYNTWEHYDQVFLSKIFTFTQDWQEYINADQIIKGGTGYDFTIKLPNCIDHIQPDYDLYKLPKDIAYGFLTRGCCNSCKWCIVPKKEGKIQPYMDIEEISIENRNKVILMDNNILASEYGLNQLEKIAKLKIAIDLNQGIDARKIDFETAKLLASIKWLKYIRLACDTSEMIAHCDNAINLLRKAGYHKHIFIYMLINNDYEESLNRLNYYRKNNDISPFAQPYRDFANPNHKIPTWQKHMARWCNRKEIYRSILFKDYKYNTIIQ